MGAPTLNSKADVQRVIDGIKYERNGYFLKLRLADSIEVWRIPIKYSTAVILSIDDLTCAVTGARGLTLHGPHIPVRFGETTEAELVRTMMHMLAQMEIHEAYEHFRYKNIQVFDPHADSRGKLHQWSVKYEPDKEIITHLWKDQQEPECLTTSEMS